ncbi:polysaccharide biosynthesis protein GtrA [Pararhodobacter marinus]|uniref:Polysaccharide biosynthesis protein GtrA n=1 Tax=Pararhodobacter marinus TaxID=2184063 RepID=A0A2U2CGG5_9RHOB|nr:GtrA family protein [Pararhodobacter marinus]PWE30988.1 polysaccharide biosynthesis protein GtrA [Pararhodobacter marinus]
MSATGWTLLWRYSAFAAIATLANLGAQRLVLRLGDGPLLFALAVVAGTGLGLVVKYALDKRWIFADTETGMRAHSRKFGLYTVMGLVTTAIFWGTETAFWLAFETHEAREIGAVLGLAVGYVVKYRLDKRFVFTGRVAEGV